MKLHERIKASIIMGQREGFFKELAFSKLEKYDQKKLECSDLERSNWLSEVTRVYRRLGGRLEETPINYGNWDISTRKLIIELDEERHFNRYRLLSLSSVIYADYRGFSISDYSRFCVDREPECLGAAKYGGYWKNQSSEKMFPKSNSYGDLTGNGSSRWRQRAYYDFLRDVTSLVTDIPLVRVSIYDKFRNQTLNDILKNRDKNSLSDFICELEKNWCE